MEKRKVRITIARGTYFVSYVERQKHCRYSAAQFAIKYNTLDQVKDWIAKHNLELVV